MDLIYMNSDRLELGVLQHYTLDLDVAKDKDFEIVTLDDETLLEAGWWWYIAGTEYGGRIDKVSHDTNAKTVKYYGRNWRGILNSKIIEPADSTSSVVADGNVATAFQGLIERSGFAHLFTVDTSLEEGEAELTTTLFAYPRYCTVYDGMIALLNSLNAKLRIYYDGVAGIVTIKPCLISDHSDYLTYISMDSLNFTVSQRRGGINHLVCLGQSDMEGARAVIHLFLDESNVLQPFRKTETPVRNSDYILDKSGQMLFDLEERATVLDAPNAQITYNYVLLGRMPGDWQTNYKNYYIAEPTDEDDELSTLKYKNVEPVIQEVYTPLDSKPGDWEAGQGKYYTFDGSEYHPVGLVEGPPSYNYYDSVPDDWSNNYGSYYVETWNGVEYVYSSVASATENDWPPQKSEPDDWKTNFKSYYMLRSVAAEEYGTKTYKAVSGVAPAWKTGTYFQKKSNGKYDGPLTTKPDKWSTYYKDYYTRKKNSKGEYVYSSVKAVAPTFTSGTYYYRNGGKYEGPLKNKPEKWADNYRDYYTMYYKLPTSVDNSTSKYVNVLPTASGKAPKWVKNKYYTKYSTSVAPTFKKATVGSQKIVSKVTTQVMPDFEPDMYYSYVKLEVAPPFTTGTYYEKTEDWYKVLCEDGIKKLEDLNKTESQTVTLGNMPAEIGDVVSGFDIVTGIEVYEHVTNVIVKIKNDVLFTDYEIGGKA